MNGVWLKFDDLIFLDPSEFKGLDLESLDAHFDLTEEFESSLHDTRSADSGPPLISWLLGRMAYMSCAPDFPRCAIRRDSELGEIRMRFLVTRGAIPIAKLLIGMSGGKTEFSGKSSSIESANELLSKFVATMRENHDDTADIIASATAHELGGHKNEYGIANGQLLGTSNVYR